MARIKSFFGCSDLKTGGVVIGWLSLFANIIYLIFDIELILLFNFEQTQEKKDLFGSYINEINTSSPAFPIVLFATIASLYGIIASALLLCGALCVSSIAFLTFSFNLASSFLNDLIKKINRKILLLILSHHHDYSSWNVNIIGKQEACFVVAHLSTNCHFEHFCPCNLHHLPSHCGFRKTILRGMD